MAIPLRALKSLDPNSHPPRASMDSEASAILSYALGKYPQDEGDSGPEDDSPRPSSEQDSEDFFKENDPLTSDYEPAFPRKQVPPSFSRNVLTEEKSRRFRLCLILVFGALLLVWIGALIGFLSKGYFLPYKAPASPIAASRRMTFDQVVKGWEFRVNYRELEWTQSLAGQDGVFLLREDGQIIRANVNGTREVILTESDPQTRSRMWFQRYWISGDEEYILLATNVQKNWRYSYRASYYIYHISSKETIPLINEDPDVLVDYAIWSPSQAKIAYVLNHDVYIHDVPTQNTERVTYDGGTNVFNGVADWVFEEEVFNSPGCLWWSPDSSHLAYIHINETLVPIYSIPFYIDTEHPSPMAYPKFKDIKYPKPGYPNPVADVYIYTPGSSPWLVTYPEPPAKRTTREIDERDFLDDLLGIWERAEGDESDGWGNKKLITNVEWMGNEMVMISETNRVSDHFRGVLVDVASRWAQVVRDEKVQEGWFEISHEMKYVPKDVELGRYEDGYIDVVDRDGWNHLGYFSPLNSSTPQYITGGNWEVTGGIAAFDKTTNTVYFTSTRRSPVERHLYSIDLWGTNLKALTPDQQGYYTVSFSTRAQYYQLTYRGPGLPHQQVLSTTNSSFSLILEDNTRLNATLRKYDLPQLVYGTIKSVDGYDLNYREIRPPNFDDSGKTKYPVLFFCYGGPVSQNVDKRFGVEWHFWLASEPRLEYLVVQVDGRGTGFMGRKMRAGVRGQLGILEAEDQAHAAAEWKRKEYVNPEKVALWGWSYGGFLTLKTLESQPGAFPYAMAVAPVTDWRYYDSIYSERYMLTPHDNPAGYAASAITNVSAMAEAKRFFMAHGTGDDNVHTQNSLVLMDKLVAAGVRNWDSQVFTDDDHSINFHGGYEAVIWRLAEWLERWFGRKEAGGRTWKVDGELLGVKEGVDDTD